VLLDQLRISSDDRESEAALAAALAASAGDMYDKKRGAGDRLDEIDGARRAEENDKMRGKLARLGAQIASMVRVLHFSTFSAF
jgi:hypothetical protein